MIAGYTDYSAAFYTYDVLLLISAVTVAVMPLGAKLPADNLLRDLINIIKMPHIIVFIFFLFALGNFWGFIESYLFIYLKELGAPNFLLGKDLNLLTLPSVRSQDPNKLQHFRHSMISRNNLVMNSKNYEFE